jgi:hypothetical protein
MIATISASFSQSTHVTLVRRRATTRQAYELIPSLRYRSL